MPSVNEAITDSVTQVNTKVLGDSNFMATGDHILSPSEALTLGAQYLTYGQQQANVFWQAATVQGVSALIQSGDVVNDMMTHNFAMWQDVSSQGINALLSLNGSEVTHSLDRN